LPEKVAVFSGRATLLAGRLAGPQDTRGATSYCWMIWRTSQPPRYFVAGVAESPQPQSDTVFVSTVTA